MTASNSHSPSSRLGYPLYWMVCAGTGFIFCAAAALIPAQAVPPRSGPVSPPPPSAVELARRNQADLPVPTRTRELFPLAKQMGKRLHFQACYESAHAQADLLGFYAYHLYQAGWRAEQRFAKTLSANGVPSLVYSRGTQQILINFFPTKHGSEYRIALISRASRGNFDTISPAAPPPAGGRKEDP